MNKPPAFQFYADDFLSGTSDMTAEEVGVYIRLLCYQWSKGSIPNDDARLSLIAGHCHGNAIAHVRHKFGICEDGAMRNSRLEEERKKQAVFRDKQSQNAKSRWKCGPGIAKPDAVALPVDMPNTCSPSPSPSPNIESSGQATVAPEIPECEGHPEIPKTPRAKFAPPTIEQVAEYIESRGEDPNEAQNFFDYYESNGWKVGKNQMKSWGSALSRWIRTAKGFSSNGRNSGHQTKVYGETTEEKHRRFLAEAIR